MPSYDFDKALAAGVPINEINQEISQKMGYRYEDALKAGVTDEDILKELRTRFNTPENQSKEIGDQLIESAKKFGNAIERNTKGVISGAIDLAVDTPQFLASLPIAVGAGLRTGDWKGARDIVKHGVVHPVSNFSEVLEKAGEETYRDTSGHKAVMLIPEAFGTGAEKLGQGVSKLTGNEHIGAATELATFIGASGGIPFVKPAVKAVSKGMQRFVKADDLHQKMGYGTPTERAALAELKEKQAAASKAKQAPPNNESIDVPADVKNAIMEARMGPQRKNLSLELEQERTPIQKELPIDRTNELALPIEQQINAHSWESTPEHQIAWERTQSKHGKAQEIEQAYLERAKQESVVEDSFTPEQASPIVDKMLGGVGKRQGGALDVSVAKETLEKLVNAKVLTRIGESMKGIPVFRAIKEGEPLDGPRSAGSWVTPDESIARDVYAKGEGAKVVKDYIPEKDLYEVHPGGWIYAPEGTDVASIMRTDKQTFGEAFPSILGGVGKKQGGAIGFKPEKTPTLEEFAKQNELDATNPLVKEVYEKYFGDVKTTTPEAKVISRIPGLPEVTSLKPVEEMLPRWYTESDIGFSNKALNVTARAFRENLTPGRIVAERTGNSFIDWSVETILGNLGETQVKVKRINNELKGQVKQITGGTLAKFNPQREQIFVDTMKELKRVQDTTETPNIRPEAKPFVDTLRKAWDDFYDAAKEVMPEADAKRFLKLPNYLTAVFNGQYRSLVTKIHENGTKEVLGVIASRTIDDARVAVKAMQQKFPDVNIPEPAYQKGFETGGDTRFRRYAPATTIMEALKQDSAFAKEFQEAYNDFLAQSTSDFYGFKHHTKFKKGVEGSAGKTSWRTEKDNAYDLFEAQLAVLDQGYHWIAQQKTRRIIDKLLEDENIKMPEAKRYIKMYQEHAYGQLKNSIEIVDQAVRMVGEGLGLEPSILKEASSILRNAALVNTIGLSAGYAVQSGVQVPTALATAFVKARSKGIHANESIAMLIGAIDTGAILSHNTERISKEGVFFIDYAKKRGIIDPHIVEHTIHRKVIPTTGMNIVKRATADVANTVLKGIDIESQKVGAISIEKPEAVTRTSFFLTIAHYYRAAGYSLKEAAALADKDTSNHFVDYRPQERAMGFQKLGEVGKYASTVTTYKINTVNQFATYTAKHMPLVVGTLLLAQWAAGGLQGVTGMGEADKIGMMLKEKGLIEYTPKEWLLMNAGDIANFGLLNLLPGNPALSTKFNQSETIPDDLGEALWALSDYWVKGAGKTVDAIGGTKVEKGLAVRHFLPGNAKFLADYMLLTDEGKTATGPKSTDPILRKDRSEWAVNLGYGVNTQDVYKAKTMQRTLKLDEEVRNKLVHKSVENISKFILDGDQKKMSLETMKLMKLAPDTGGKLLGQKLNEVAIAHNMTVQQLLEYKLAKKAKTVGGMRQFQNYQQMK